jgi:hypothetical protein
MAMQPLQYKVSAALFGQWGRQSRKRCQLPHQLITDEEMIEGLSFLAFRRVATMIMVPGAPPQSAAMEMISISAVDQQDFPSEGRF